MLIITGYKNLEQASEIEFIQILEQHQHLLHKICKVYAPTAEQRRDLFQDITLQLWRAWPRFQARSKVSTWMYRVALNVAISNLRQKTPRTETLRDQHHETLTNNTENEQINRLYEALNHLSAVDKALAILLLEDYSYEEIAEVTGQNINHIRVKTHRLREKLRHIIQNLPTV
jgi:RNA polymerase sigma factor (sigma-70 family)